MRELTIGHSPDPDDAFMFYGFRDGSPLKAPFTFRHVIEDIESLNIRAMKGELDISAISAAHYPRVADTYRILSTGASMGRGYGPVVVSRKSLSISDLSGRRVAVPGERTTAALLTRIYVGDIEPIHCPFDRVFSLIDEEKVEAGVVIHEGQLTYGTRGYHLVVDLGVEWERETGGLPLPLGLDVVRRDLGEEMHRTINDYVRRSIRLAYDNVDDAVQFSLRYGRGLPRELCRKFVTMYVNNDTIDMGDEGRRALALLYARAGGETPALDVVD